MHGNDDDWGDQCHCDDERICDACWSRSESARFRAPCGCAACTRGAARPVAGGIAGWALAALGLDRELVSEEVEMDGFVPIAWARECARGRVEVAQVAAQRWRVTSRSAELERVYEYVSRETALLVARTEARRLGAAA